MKTPTIKTRLEFSERMVLDQLFGRIEVVIEVEGIPDLVFRNVILDSPSSDGVKDFFEGRISWEQFQERAGMDLKASLSVRPGFYSARTTPPP